MTGIILAGGENRRMGQNKALLRLNGQTLVEDIIGKLQHLFQDVLIVSSHPEAYRQFGVRVVCDIVPGKGPLGGIYSGLVHSSSPWNFVAACDMPFLNPGLIEHMKGRTGESDILIPKGRRGYEALHAFYSNACIDAIERKFASRTGLQVIDLLDDVRTVEIGEEEIRRFDPDGSAFFNINTPEDLERACRFAERSDLQLPCKNPGSGALADTAAPCAG